MDYILMAGMDEAGRGPLAGPVTAGCVVLPPDFPHEILNDSKKLSEKKRDIAYQVIIEKACWGFARIEHDEIDKINVLQAALKAMSIAYEQMKSKLPFWLEKNNLSKELISSLSAITDGTSCPNVDVPVRAEPKADGKYPCVMAASIIAKVERDRIMKEYDAIYPAYGYAKHKGYPTKAHMEICRQIGPSPIQRLTFKY